MTKALLATRRPDQIPLREPIRAKRSVLTEAAGVPVAIAHDGANRHDHKLLAPNVCVDTGQATPPDARSAARPVPKPFIQ